MNLEAGSLAEESISGISHFKPTNFLYMVILNPLQIYSPKTVTTDR